MVYFGLKMLLITLEMKMIIERKGIWVTAATDGAIVPTDTIGIVQTRMP